MIQAHGPPSPKVWCFGGFVFPALILAIGLTFERGQVPDESDLTTVWVHPGTLNYIVGGLALGHAIGAALALARWPAPGLGLAGDVGSTGVYALRVTAFSDGCPWDLAVTLVRDVLVLGSATWRGSGRRDRDECLVGHRW